MAKRATLPATKQESQVSPLSSEMEGLIDDMGTGLENVTGKDLVIPRLTILQGLSPQLNKAKAEFDKEAKNGDIYDVGMKQRFAEPFLILPVHFMKQWLEWGPRNSDKGLVAIHNTEEVLQRCTPDERGKPTTPDGNYIQETAQFFVLNVAANWRRSFLPMASTQLKKSRQLLTFATEERLTRKDGTTFMPPLFYRLYTLGVVPESNAEGDWNGWSVDRGPTLAEHQPDKWVNIMHEVKEFRAAVSAGDVVGDMAAAQEEVKPDGAM